MVKKIIAAGLVSAFSISAFANASDISYTTGDEVKRIHSYSEVSVSECTDNRGAEEYKASFFGDQRTAFRKYIESTSSYDLKIKKGRVVVTRWNGEVVNITCKEIGGIRH